MEKDQLFFKNSFPLPHPDTAAYIALLKVTEPSYKSIDVV